MTATEEVIEPEPFCPTQDSFNEQSWLWDSSSAWLKLFQLQCSLRLFLSKLPSFSPPPTLECIRCAAQSEGSPVYSCFLRPLSFTSISPIPTSMSNSSLVSLTWRTQTDTGMLSGTTPIRDLRKEKVRISCSRRIVWSHREFWTWDDLSESSQTEARGPYSYTLYPWVIG